jgi:glycosyltransferase involved in cell wall biosynthesis
VQPNRYPFLKRIAFIGSFLPRKCGVATFNVDLANALSENYHATKSIVLAVNEPGARYLYPGVVTFQIEQEDVLSYRAAARFLKQEDVDLVCLHHEYGLYGSSAGSRIISLLQDIDIPIVTILHTVLRSPDLQQRKVLVEISRLSDRLVAMTKYGVTFLREIYKIPEHKITLIPHGTPEAHRDLIDGNRKTVSTFDGKKLLLTYGLLSPNKGLEYAIQALPAIIKAHPDVIYVIAGSTHPNIRRQSGESYRQHLHQLSQDVGVANYVIFKDQFFNKEELLKLIDSAQVCITPYLNEEQIVSGTLAYMIARGKNVVSTPYWHARELSESSPVTIVPFKDSLAISDSISHLLETGIGTFNHANQVNQSQRDTSWTVVAHQYMSLFREVASRRVHSNQVISAPNLATIGPSFIFPELKIDHLLRLTDDTGLLQHAVWRVPNYNEGYTTDDNARALIVSIMLKSLGKHDGHKIDHLIDRYLAFIVHAFNRHTGRFRNFMSFDRRWLEEVGSEESHCRALWSLGVLVNRTTSEQGLVNMASHLFLDALPTVRDFASPRAWAFAIIGIHEFLNHYTANSAAEDLRDLLTQRLVKLFSDHSTKDWPWFEDELTWFNARLPQALLLCGNSMSQPRMKEIAFSSLRWLLELQRAEKGHFRALGNERFYRRGDGNIPRFDQQPIEAAAMISACIAAYHSDNDKIWLSEALRIFLWFMGDNDLGLALYDSHSGGCRDALHPDRINENQGAESTLAFLLSLLELTSIC